MSERGRADALELVAAALAAVDPRRAVERALGDLATSDLTPGEGGRLVVVGAGKAAAPMAAAAEALLGERIDAGLVIAPRGAIGAEPLRLELARGGHPLPDPSGARATRRLLGLVEPLGAADVVLCLISGGASALMSLPLPPLSLEELRATTDALLRAGVPIEQLNTVRKHLSLIKGGGLAAAVAPARLVSLILSDVVGSPLTAIASGPTVADPTTFDDALAVVERFELAGELPEVALGLLREGAAGGVPETPKPGEPRLDRVTNLLVGDNARAAEAVVRRARALGYGSLLLTTHLEGEARAAGGLYAALLREVARHGRPLPRPCCLVLGGETTVAVRGAGRGGRNQEAALAAAPLIAGLQRVLLLTLATDGVDGPTDAAGAIVDGETAARATAAGLSIPAHLDENDAYPLLDALGALLRLGPTGTNVNDLALLLAW